MSEHVLQAANAVAPAHEEESASQVRSMQPPSFSITADGGDPGPPPSAVGVGMVSGPMQRTESDPYQEYKGDAVNKEGRVSCPGEQYAIASTEGVNIRETPNGALSPVGKILYNARIQVVCLDTTGAFYYIVPMEGGPTGWIDRRFVATEAPDPLAELHNIQEPDLTTILKQHYVDTGIWSIGSGNDYTTLAAAVQVANEGRAGVTIDWAKVEEYKDNHTLKRTLDPWMIDNFAIYHSSNVAKNHNIWLPSVSFVKGLQDSGVIGSRPDWLNTAIEVGQGIVGFVSGVQVGLFQGVWEMVEGLWEIGKMIVNTVKSVLDGSFFSSIQDIYDQLTNMTWEQVQELVNAVITMAMEGLSDFEASWNAPNMFNKWHFRGKVIGQVVLEVVLAIFTGGASLGAKVLLKVGSKFPKLAKLLGGLLKAADKLTPGGHRKPDGPDMPDGNRRNGQGDGRGDGERRKKDDEDMSKDDRAWEQTRMMAKVVTEGHDAKDTPIPELIGHLEAQFAMRSPVVKGYKAQDNGDGSYQILQLTRRNRNVDRHYTPREERRNLDDHEGGARRGHTIAEHVGKSDAYLIDRLKRNPDMKHASSFFDWNSANLAQARCTSRYGKEIREYLSSGNMRPHIIEFDMGRPIGKFVKRGKGKSEKTSRVRMVVVRNPEAPQGWSYTTSFPIP